EHLDAELAMFPIAAGLRAAVPVHAREVVRLERHAETLPVVQVCADDRRRSLGPKSQRAVSPIREGVHLLADHVAGRSGGPCEDLGRLEPGRLHVAEPVEPGDLGGTVVDGAHHAPVGRQEVARAAAGGEVAHPASRRNGFEVRSAPTVVSAPCPGKTRVASGNVRNRISDRRIAAGSEFAKSERPIVPAKTRSPENRTTSSSIRKHEDPGVWPGVCRTSRARPANRSTSPSTKVRRSRTGSSVAAPPPPQAG